MLNTGRTFVASHPELATCPGAAILVATIRFSRLGDGLRDALDRRPPR